MRLLLEQAHLTAARPIQAPSVEAVGSENRPMVCVCVCVHSSYIHAYIHTDIHHAPHMCVVEPQAGFHNMYVSMYTVQRSALGTKAKTDGGPINTLHVCT